MVALAGIADTCSVTSVVIPAHNESAVIGRLLDALTADARPDEFDIIVVCNGCTDDTSGVAHAHAPQARVIELTEPSKRLALMKGDATAVSFPRLYVDADVILDTAGARALVDALSEPGLLAVAPRRQDALDQCSPAVRAYYRVWTRLPAVQEGLYGRGVIAVSEQGYERIASRPDVLGYDLHVHTQFAPSERRIVAQATSIVYAPRTLPDLLQRRTRAAQGNAQLRKQTGGRSDTTESSVRELARLASREPRLWPGLAVFSWVTLVARRRARKADRSGQPATWLRDESTRG
jgi:hypothetical protein